MERFISAIKVAHVTPAFEGSGATVFLFSEKIVATALVVGSAPASREFAMLQPGNSVEAIDALLFTGGSAFGLDSAAGVVRFLRKKGRGVLTSGGRVPICPAFAIFDLPKEQEVLSIPTPDQLELACEQAAPFHEEDFIGQIGAGFGARTCQRTKPGGIGCCVSTKDGIFSLAFVVVNSYGSLRGEEGEPSSETPDALFNTTLVFVITSLKETRLGLIRIAKMATSGLARALDPAFTPFDGDVIVVASLPLDDKETPSLAQECQAGQLAANAVVGTTPTILPSVFQELAVRRALKKD